MLYIVVIAAWCLLASVGLAICRLSALSDEAHALELAECFALAARRRREQTLADEAVERSPEGQVEARRAIG
ncbi:MAG TPA: hypothetical protein VK707_05410 [Solirubrobacteraceae bacterium]|nr:hypothetical protein [Solirubrobacteraceae bacterium]